MILHNQPESIYLTCLCTFNHIFQEQGYHTFNLVMCRCIFCYGVAGVRNDYLSINKTMVTVFTLPATWWCQGCVRHSPGLPVHVPTSVNLHARDTPECSTRLCLVDVPVLRKYIISQFWQPCVKTLSLPFIILIAFFHYIDAWIFILIKQQILFVLLINFCYLTFFK